MSEQPLKLRDAVVALVAATEREAAAEAELEAAKAERNWLETQVLPDLMGEIGVSDVVVDGTKVKLSPVATGSLPKEDEPRRIATEWLATNGYSDFVQCVVAAKWGKGDRDKAVAAFNTLRGDNSAAVSLAEDVHWKTLCKIALDRFKTGLEVPLQTLGVTILPRARITSKKESP